MDCRIKWQFLVLISAFVNMLTFGEARCEDYWVTLAIVDKPVL